MQLTPTFSVLVSFRNRDAQRVKNSLDSLAKQSFKAFELIFIDYGSELELSSEIEQVVKAYDFASYVYFDSRGWFWNKSHAMNMAINRAKGEFAVLWDIDLMVEPDFLERLALKDFDKIYTIHRCLYLPEESNRLNYKDSKILSQAKHAYVGLGIVKTEVLHRINGFNEFFQVWGAEDDDIFRRIEAQGLERVYVNSDEAVVYHQWHATLAPNLPNMWYTSLVEAFYGLRKDHMDLQKSGEFFGLANRPVRSLDLNKTKHIDLNFNQNFLVYNELLDWLSSSKTGESAYINQRVEHFTINSYMESFSDVMNSLSKALGLNLRIVNQAKLKQEQTIQNILEFFHYFIGVYRDRILDYEFSLNKGVLIFAVIKK